MCRCRRARACRKCPRAFCISSDRYTHRGGRYIGGTRVYNRDSRRLACHGVEISGLAVTIYSWPILPGLPYCSLVALRAWLSWLWPLLLWPVPHRAWALPLTAPITDHNPSASIILHFPSIVWTVYSMKMLNRHIRIIGIIKNHMVQVVIIII